MNDQIKIQRNEDDSTSIFEERSIKKDYRTLIPILKPGLRVLDVGCGTGAITMGLCKYLGRDGCVIGIDSNPGFIGTAKAKSQAFKNLEFIHQNLFSYQPAKKFDLVIAARTLQWLPNPDLAIKKMKVFLKAGGQLSILDYNHSAIEWEPKLPSAMQALYDAFLKWRAEMGLNNGISEDLPHYFKEAGFEAIEVFDANEIYSRNQPDFMSKLGIWDKVAALPQIVEEGFLDTETLKHALQTYGSWKTNKAKRMVLKLKEVRGLNLYS